MPYVSSGGRNIHREVRERYTGRLQARRLGQDPITNPPEGGSTTEKQVAIRRRGVERRNATISNTPPEATARGKSDAARTRGSETRRAVASSIPPEALAGGKVVAARQKGIKGFLERMQEIQSK